MINSRWSESVVTMPDLKGLTMYEVVRNLSSYGLEMVFQGRGLVIEQTPSPGERLLPGRKCTFKFHPPTGGMNL